MCWQLPTKVGWEPGPDGDNTEVATVRRCERRDCGGGGRNDGVVLHRGRGSVRGERPVVEALGEELESVVGKTVYAELHRRLTR